MSYAGAHQSYLTHGNVVERLIRYFKVPGLRDIKVNDGQHFKTLLDFVRAVYPGKQPMPLPDILADMMRQMCTIGIMEAGDLNVGLLGTELGRYYRCRLNLDNENTMLERINFASSIIYGPFFISRKHIPYTRQIKHTSIDGRQQSGTAYVISENTAITAAHCIEGASSIAIKGLSSAALKNSKVYFHSKKLNDIAIITTDEKFDHSALLRISGRVKELDDVVIIGCPQIPTLDSVPLVERAVISGTYSYESGRVSGIARSIFTSNPMLVINARIRGGFSGGPVFSGEGKLVGVITHSPEFDDGSESYIRSQQYDSLGYGLAASVNTFFQLAQAIRIGREDLFEVKLGKEFNFEEFDY